MAREMVYMATDPHCGHVVGMTVDTADRAEDVADEVWRWVRDGCLVTRVSAERARTADLCQCARKSPDAENGDPAEPDHDQTMTTAACMGHLANYALDQAEAYRNKARGLRGTAHLPTTAEFFGECAEAWQIASFLCEERAAAVKQSAADLLTRKLTEARSEVQEPEETESGDEPAEGEGD